MGPSQPVLPKLCPVHSPGGTESEMCDTDPGTFSLLIYHLKCHGRSHPGKTQVPFFVPLVSPSCPLSASSEWHGHLCSRLTALEYMPGPGWALSPSVTHLVHLGLTLVALRGLFHHQEP